MDNAEALHREKSNKSNWTDAPLFAANVVPQINDAVSQIPDNSASRISDENSPPLINVEPQKISDLPRQSIPATKTNLAAAEIIEPEQRENSELRREENVESSGAENPVLQPQRKARKKTSVKKIRSQKRNVVPLKLFVSPVEKAQLETRAKTQNCSLSNYLRLHLGLAPNEAGRKKQNVVAAFDLSELELDPDIKN